jgi:type III secretory pathway component EscV
MADIKSAAEIAREKLEKIGEPTEAERLKWKYAPEGEKLAARYLREDTVNLQSEIKKYDDKARKVVAASINDILQRNISLPRNEITIRTNRKAMEGLKALKNNKAAVENVLGRMRHVLDHYVNEGDKQKKQAYESLKAEFEAKVQQAVRQKTGVNAKIKVDVEKQPQFLDEWQQVLSQIEGQYTKLFDEYKRELSAID